MYEIDFMEPNISIACFMEKLDVSIIYFLFILLISYLIGSFHLSYFIGKSKGINLKEAGSKNFGASNTFALLGKKYGILVFVSDFLKGFLLLYLILSGNLMVLNDIFTPDKVSFLNLFTLYFNDRSVVDSIVYILSVLGVVLGHIYPFYLKFNGGKGFATYLGALVAFSISFDINFIPLIIFAVTLALLTDYIVAATFSIIILFPILAIYSEGLLATGFLIASLVILYKHRENITNIRTGKEMRIRSAFKNKYKVENMESDKDSENNK